MLPTHQLCISIRAPTKGAMATHSKIRPIRALTLPLSQQNRHNLGNPVPLTHPCAHSLRKNAPILCLLEVYTRTFLAYLTVICVAVANFRSSRQTTFFWSTTSPNQATHLTSLDNQSPHQAFPLDYKQDFIYKSVTHIQNVFIKKMKNDLERY